jgi:hypothetical protein
LARAISDAFQAQLASGDVKPVLFYEGAISGTTMRLWTGSHNIEWGGYTWLGNGWLHGVSSLKSDNALIANGAGITLTGVPSELIASLLGNVQQSSMGRIWLGFIGNDKQIAKFTAANLERLKVLDNTSLSVTGHMTISAWVKFGALADQVAVAKYFSTGNNRSYYLGIDVSGYPKLILSPDGVNAFTETLTTPVVAGQWCHLIAYYDGIVMGVKLDNAGETTAHTTGIYNSTADFFLGSYRDGDGGGFNLDGQMRCTGIWNRALSASEMTELYNDGYPVYYDHLSTTIKASLVSYWDLDEISLGTGAVTRSDSHGTNHLTDENTVVSIRANDTLLTADPLLLFTGLLDRPSIHESAEGPLIELAYESELIRLDTANIHRYTDEGQQAFYPNDKGFEYVAFLEQWNGYWGRQEVTKNE